MDDVKLKLPEGLPGPELVALLGQHESLGKLMDLLSRDEALRSLLFLAKGDLFILDDDQEFPRFHAVHLEGNENDLVALDNIVSEDLAGSYSSLPNTLALGSNDSFGTDLMELLLFAAVIGIRNDEEFRDLVQAKAISLHEFRTLVASRGGLASLLDDLASASKADLEQDERFLREAERATGSFVQHIQDNADLIMEGLGSGLPNALAMLHTQASEWQDRVESLAGLDEKEIRACIGELVRLELVSTKSALAWCAHCGQDRTNYQLLSGTWAPEKYSNLKCFNCRRRLSYAALYLPRPHFKQLLLSRDGILAAYVYRRLSTGEKLDRAFFHAGGRENDFVTKEGVLVEVKMFKTSRAHSTLRQSLENEARRLAGQVESIQTELPQLKRVVLITNLDSAIVEAFSTSKFDTGQLQFNILGLDDLDDL